MIRKKVSFLKDAGVLLLGYVELMLLFAICMPHKWSKFKNILGERWKLSIIGMDIAPKDKMSQFELMEIEEVLLSKMYKLNKLFRGVEIMWAVVTVMYVLTLIICTIGSFVVPGSSFSVSGDVVVLAMTVVLFEFALTSVLTSKLMSIMRSEVKELDWLVDGTSFYAAKKAKIEAEVMKMDVDWSGMKAKKVTAL